VTVEQPTVTEANFTFKEAGKSTVIGCSITGATIVCAPK